MSTMHLSRLWYHGKLEMELILNATLAGGVAVGSASDLITTPWAAIFVGYFGGALSCLGFHKIGPYLKKQYGLEDTCGVHSLHGMPGVLAAIISAITIAAAGSDSFPDGYFTHSTSNSQAKAQIWSLLTTLAIAIMSGALTGYLASFEFWRPSLVLFKDDDHIDEVLDKSPASFKTGDDEPYGSYEDFVQTMKYMRTGFALQNADEAIEAAVHKVWNDCEDPAIFYSKFAHKYDPTLNLTEEAVA